MADNSQQSTVNRRKVLKLGSAAAVTLTGSAGVVAATSDRQVEFVRYLLGQPPNREKVYDTIPEDEWGDRHTAIDLGERIDNRIRRKWDDPWIKTWFRPLSESPTGFGVEVTYTTYIDMEEWEHTPEPPIDEVRRELPNKGAGRATKGEHDERRQDIPIRVVESEERPTNCDGEGGSYCQDYVEYSDVPGGVAVTHEGSSPDARCSICASWNDPDYGDSWLGAGHCATSGELVTHRGGDLGTVRHKKVTLNHDIDYCVIDADQNKTPVPKIADDDASGNYRYEVVGIVSDNTLHNDAGTATNYLTQGRTTCRTSGTIISVCLSDDCVVTDHDTEDGDSGGTLFSAASSTEACIAGVIGSEINDGEDDDNCGDDTKSTTAETLESKRGGSFMTV